MFPSPPRALFMYMWGEALTACRILPAGPYRWRALPPRLTPNPNPNLNPNLTLG